MKNVITLLSFSLLLSTNLIAQQLFEIFEYEESMYDFVHSDKSQIKNSVLLDINWFLIEEIINNNPETIKINFPFLNDLEIDLELQQFTVYSEEISVVRHTLDGTVFEKYTPTIKTYRIDHPNQNMKGVFIFEKTGLKAVFTIDDQTYQIDKFKMENHTKEELYFLANINDSPIDFDFACAQDDLHQDV